MSERSDGEYIQSIHYFPEGETHGTNHLVESIREDGTQVVTACGRTLRRVTSRSPTTIGGGYVADIEDQRISDQEKCGNCPWDEVDDA